MVKNLPAMQETWVRSLGQEDLLEKGMAYPLQYSCLENSVGRESNTTEQLSDTRILTKPFRAEMV